MTKEYLAQRLAQITKHKEQILANYNVAIGQEAELKQLLASYDKVVADAAQAENENKQPTQLKAVTKSE